MTTPTWPSTCGRAAVWLAVAVALLFVGATASAAAADVRLWDEAHALSSRQRADVDKRLAAAARRLGSPVHVLVTNAHRSETAATLAARVFSERRLRGPDESNPVLLVISVRPLAAAIETGKGIAGIVPEIDASRITKRLRSAWSRTGPGEALARAIDEIVVSAQATAARRRPLATDEDPPPPDVTHMPDTGADTSANAEGTGAAAAGSDAGDLADADGPADAGAAHDGTSGGAPSKKTRGLSRSTIAAAIAVLVLLALALRRRRQLTAARRLQDKPVEPPKRGPTFPRR